MASLQGVDDAALMSRVLEYYQSAAPLIETSFAQTPIVFRHYPICRAYRTSTLLQSLGQRQM